MPQETRRLRKIINNRLICSVCRLSNLFRKHDNKRPRFLQIYQLPPNCSDNGGDWNSLYCITEKGFTLIELMIAFAIVGVLATIAIPNILGEIPKFRLNGAANEIVGDLMAARMKAVSQNRKVKVFFPGENQYYVCDDNDNNGTVDDCETTRKSIDGATLNSNNNPIFSPRGTASNLPTISVTNSAGTRKITIAITGRIQISK